jgi:hypothetical protein
VPLEKIRKWVVGVQILIWKIKDLIGKKNRGNMEGL